VPTLRGERTSDWKGEVIRKRRVGNNKLEIVVYGVNANDFPKG